MQCAVEMGSGVMIYIPSFIKTGSGIQKLIWGYTDSMVIPQAYFYFLNKENRLKTRRSVHTVCLLVSCSSQNKHGLFLSTRKQKTMS
jgi:hypothetical protein